MKTSFVPRSRFIPAALFLTLVHFGPCPAAPVISSFSPASAALGATVTINGSGFHANPTSNTVYFGSVRASVGSVSTSNLTVTVPAGATYAPITVTVAGLTAYGNSPFLPTFRGPGLPIDTSAVTARTDFPADNGPIQVVLADLDGDGKPDLAVANAYAHTLCIYRNVSTNGSLAAGSFAPRVVLSSGASGSDNPLRLVAADLDGDGKLDLVFPDRNANSVTIYRNISTPGTITSNSFAPPVSIPVGSDPRDLAVADLDGDGRPEIVTANYGGGSISILRNISTPGVLNTSSFAAEVEIASDQGCYGIAIGDLDGDGKPDIAVNNGTAGTISVFRNVATLGSIDTNSLAAPASLPAPGTGCYFMSLADLDGDGRSELIFTCYLGATMSVYPNLSSPGALDANSFGPRLDFSTGARAHDISIGDLDGDGKPDIAVSCELASQLSVFPNLSSPGAIALGNRVDFATGYNAWGIAIGDLDGDGEPDMVFANSYDNTVSTYRNLFGAPPAITSQPANQSAIAGTNVSFAVVATGLGLNYQWLFNGTNIAGATNTSLLLTNVQFSQAGYYSVQVTNLFGMAISSNALLNVTFPPAAVLVVPTNGLAGRIIVVPVNLVANGNENSFGFSLNFNPQMLTYAGAALGSGAPGASFFTNTSQLPSGRLGLAVVLPYGATLSPGSRQIALVSFTAAVFTGQTRSTTISFGDQPELRQLLDTQLNSLPATYTEGDVSIAPAPAFEGDVSPRPNGDNNASLSDWLLLGRYAARLDYPTNASEFQRADCAPRATLGDGQINVADWVQAGRYVFGLDALTPIGGPTNESSTPLPGPSPTRLLNCGQAALGPGQTGPMPITLASQGNENALSFTLTYNTNALGFVGAALGNDAAGSTLFVNTTSAGRLGVALALGAGNSFAPGSREILRLSFQSAGPSAGSFPVDFVALPVALAVSDPAGNLLPISSRDGAILINNAPTMSIARAGQSILLTWPLWASNFTLQEAATGLRPTGTWTNLSVTPALSNNQSVVTLPLSAVARFYRLYHP